MALISNPDNPISPQGVLVLATVFTGVMWILAGTRFWVLRHYKFRRFSPRWISDLAVLMIVIFMTVSLGLLFYVYHLVLEMQVLDLKLHELETQEEHHKFRRSDSNLSGGDQNNLEAALNEQWTEVILKIMKVRIGTLLLRSYS